VPAQIREFLRFELPFVEISPKTCRRRGLKVAHADAASPIPVSHVDQMATSVVE
jgi:hypothetical protein